MSHGTLGTERANCDSIADVSPRFKSHAYNWSFDWFAGLSVSSVIG